VTVSATGFTSWEEKAIDVVGNDIAPFYPKLAVGSLQSTVSVTAAGLRLKLPAARSANAGRQTVEAAPLVEKPLPA